MTNTFIIRECIRLVEDLELKVYIASQRKRKHETKEDVEKRREERDSSYHNLIAYLNKFDFEKENVQDKAADFYVALYSKIKGASSYSYNIEKRYKEERKKFLEYMVSLRSPISSKLQKLFIKKLCNEEDFLKHFTKILYLHCVRNTVLEDIHVEYHIPDTEMKKLNIEAINKIYTFLKFTLEGNPGFIKNWRYLEIVLNSEWDEPKIDRELYNISKCSMG